MIPLTSGTFNLIEHALREGPDPCGPRGGPINQASREGSRHGSPGSPPAATRWPPRGPEHLLQMRENLPTPQGACGHAPILQGALASPPRRPSWPPWSKWRSSGRGAPRGHPRQGDGGVRRSWRDPSTLGRSSERQGYGAGALTAPHALSPECSNPLPPPGGGREMCRSPLLTPAIAHPQTADRSLQLEHPSSGFGPHLFLLFLPLWELLPDCSLAWLLPLALPPGGGSAWRPGPSLCATLPHDRCPGVSAQLCVCGSQSPSGIRICHYLCTPDGATGRGSWGYRQRPALSRKHRVGQRQQTSRQKGVGAGGGQGGQGGGPL